MACVCLHSPGLFGASKSNPSSPPHPTEGRSPPVSFFGIKRSESEYAFPISDDHTTHWKQQQASERVPSSHHRPPVYRYSTVLVLSLTLVSFIIGFCLFDPCFQTPSPSVLEIMVKKEERACLMILMPTWPRGATPLWAPFGLPEPARYSLLTLISGFCALLISDYNNTVFGVWLQPDRRRRSTDFSRELYEAEANVSPFHPSRSRSPAPHNKTVLILDPCVFTLFSQSEPEPDLFVLAAWSCSWSRRERL